MAKSTWNKFLAEKEYMFLGNYYDGGEIEYKHNRTLIDGSSVLRFKTDEGTTSFLEKKGKVSFNNNVYTIECERYSVYYGVQR